MTHERLLFPRRQDGHPFPILPMSIKPLGAVGDTHWGWVEKSISQLGLRIQQVASAGYFFLLHGSWN